MILSKAALAFFFLISVGGVGAAQSPSVAGAKKPSSPADIADPRKASPAYAEVLLRRTELESDLESLLVEYTDDHPKVKVTRFELDLMIKESDRLLTIKPTETGKLTEALGKLIVRKVELQGELWSLQQQFGDAHPDVKRAKKKVEIYEKAVKEILG